MGLASHRGVERLQAPGGSEQQRRSVAAARAGEHDLRAQPLQPRALKLVERGKRGGRQQLECRVRCRGIELRLRGIHRPLSPPRRIGAQLGRACQERRSRRRTATGLRPVGRALQLVRHRLVGPGRRLRPVPGATIGIGIRIGRLGQRSMHLLAVARVSGPVGGRPHEWMAEPHPDPELDQPGVLGRHTRVASDPEALGRAPQQAHVADRFGRRHQQQALGLARKRPNPLEEGLLDAAGHGPRVGKSEPARELGRRQPTRQLQQRQWVAARLGDDLIAHALVQPPRQGRRQQGACDVVSDPFDDHLRQADELVDVGGLTDGEHDGDPLGQQAPRHEGQRLRRGAIEPLHIVDQTHERLHLGRLGEQGEDRQGHEEAVRGVAVLQPERRAQGIALRTGQSVESVEHRRAQLVKPGERELHLRLDARDPGDATLRGPLGDVVQQRRLADPRLTAQQQHCAVAGPDALQLAVQHFALAASASQHPRSAYPTRGGAPTGQPAATTRELTGDLPGREPAPSGSRLAAMYTTEPFTPTASGPPTLGDQIAEVHALFDTVFVAGPPVLVAGAGTVLLALMLAGPFALLVTLVVVLVAAMLLVALAGAILASPYLLVRHLRVRLEKRRRFSEVSAPIATVVAARAAR
jgi:hypothetical protein